MITNPTNVTGIFNFVRKSVKVSNAMQESEKMNTTDPINRIDPYFSRDFTRALHPIVEIAVAYKKTGAIMI
jgi:hypothetical protein